MGKVKNWMMEIEEFCDGYFYGGDSEFTIDEVAADAGMYFKTSGAKKYAEKFAKSNNIKSCSMFTYIHMNGKAAKIDVILCLENI